MPDRRPLADRLEVRVPALAAVVVRVLGRLPAPVRRRALTSAFGRARDAFNRGDLEAVFALFSADVEYVPPPPLHHGGPIKGKRAVVQFWRAVFTRFEQNAIENLSLVESSPASFVRRARLSHRSTAGGQDGGGLEYTIVQVTELDRGRVVRQVNELAPGE